MAVFSVLCLVCASLLLFGGVRPQSDRLFSSAGDTITLPCYVQEQDGPRCSDMNWLHINELSGNPVTIVYQGHVLDSRLTLNPNCSLIHHNVTAEDSGYFICQHYRQGEIRTELTLKVLTVSLVPEDSDEFMTLRCRLGIGDASSCEGGNFRWIGQSQVLSVERKDCVSYLSVERESPHDRTFTCQFVESRIVQVFSAFTIEGKQKADSHKTPECSLGWWLLFVKAVGWGALICTSVVVTIYTAEKKQPKRSREDLEMTYPDFNRGEMAPDYENYGNSD